MLVVRFIFLQTSYHCSEDKAVDTGRSLTAALSPSAPLREILEKPSNPAIKQAKVEAT
jgi:hypothetical protein